MTAIEYDKCVDTYADGLYRFALKSLHDDDEAKDIVQESFLRLWERCGDVISGKEKSYLFTVAYHLIIDRTRQQKKYADDEDLSAVPAADRDGDYIRETIDRCMQSLPEVQRTLVIMRDYEGYHYNEISEITGLTESQVKVYIFRARVALKKKIGNVHDILSDP